MGVRDVRLWLLAAALAPGAFAQDEDLPKRLLVQEPGGKRSVARVYDQSENEVIVVMPDGQLRPLRDPNPANLPATDLPFAPLTPEAMIEHVKAQGPYANFRARTGKHYVLLYDCTEKFAENSLNLLESLYDGLLKSFAERGIPTREAEFPLVAIVYRREEAFRARREVEASVQAYYEVITNQIVFFEESTSDQANPKVAAMRKPQTVAHEGAHQILQNIGVQPRLAPWPKWLIEGLAEYCAPTSTRRGAQWAGMGKVNALHMATIRDLSEPLTPQLVALGVTQTRIDKPSGMSLSEYLVTRPDLNPTDYALSWAMTHYLASRRGKEFAEYLKQMAALRPLEQVTELEHLQRFKQVFKREPAALDRDVTKHLGSLKYDELPYYAVMFEYPNGPRTRRRVGVLTQSPSVIRQEYEKLRMSVGDQVTWRVIPCSSRRQAALTMEQMLSG